MRLFFRAADNRSGPEIELPLRRAERLFLQNREKNQWVSLLIALLVFLPGLVYAQEDTGATEDEPEQQNASSILYLGVPVVYSEGVDPLMPPPAPPMDPEQDPEFLTRASSIEDYTRTVSQIEASGGAWDANLVESLSALGRLQQAQGDHAAAVATLDRALHINRINSGLHTTEQIEIVEGLIESYLALQDWEKADLFHSYLFYIQQKAYGPNDPRMVPALARLGEWNLQAFEIGFGDPLGLRLSTANILYNSAARMLSLHFGRDDDRFVPYLENIAESAFLVASNPEIMNEIDRPQYRSSQDLLRDALQDRSAVIPMGYRVGESALMEIIAYYQETDQPVLLAEAYTQLGDWYLLSESRRNAEEQYRNAWDLLAAVELEPETSPEQIEAARAMRESLFSEVTPIPGYALRPRWIANYSVERVPMESLQWGEIDLSFTVTRNGQVRDMELIGDATGLDVDRYDRIRRELRRYRFRPRLVEGEAVESENNLVRFRFWY